MGAASGCPVEGWGARLQPAVKNSRQTPQFKVALLIGPEFLGYWGGFVNAYSEAAR